MRRRLHFICPTDGIEPALTLIFGEGTYFYTSLGNSVKFDRETATRIQGLILKRNIQEICFVLSNTNTIIQDALGKQRFSKFGGLHHFYSEILKQQKKSKVLGSTNDNTLLILSYHLNKKIKELVTELKRLNMGSIKVIGKIYNKEANRFHEIYPDLVCTEHFSLN